MKRCHEVVWMAQGAGALWTAVLLLGASCASPDPARQAEDMVVAEAGPVLLTAGDEIEVKFFYNTDLNETQRIRPDGKITLQLIGDIVAEGKTPEELKYMIGKLASLFIEDPAVSVFVRSFANRGVFVGGQVVRPGPVEMPGHMTALDAVLRAGGFKTRTARMETVVVIRHEGGQRYGCTLNLASAVKGMETKAFPLKPGDIVYVPNTKVVQVGQWIDQHINKIVPQFGVVYSKELSDGATIAIDTARDFTPVF